MYVTGQDPALLNSEQIVESMATKWSTYMAIGGILSFWVACSRVQEQKTERTRSDVPKILLLADAVDRFKEREGRFPTEKEGLLAVFEAFPGNYGWAEHVYSAGSPPLDSWRREFIYYPDVNQPKGYVIYSLGADGRSESMGFDEDDINPLARRTKGANAE